MTITALSFISCLRAENPDAANRVALDYCSAIAAGEPDRVSATILLPDGTKAEERVSERLAAATSFEVIVGLLGVPRGLRVATNEAPAYLIAVGGGPRPFWWRAEIGVETEVVLETRFAQAGPGQLRVYLVDGGTSPAVVAVAFGLGVERAGACDDIRAVAHALLDRQAVPLDHPTRSIDCASLRSREE